jgi:Putative DNA-binding domain
MTVLAEQQRALLNAIFTTNKIASQAINTLATSLKTTSNRGLKVYQANAHASALRSLQTVYPVVAQLIGQGAFEHLARDLWAQHPPKHGDMAQWGGDFPVFIASISTLKSEPYLSDVARAEWAVHTAATAADQSADLATFLLLTERDPDAISLQLAPGTALISSIHPVASILTAHLYAQPALEAVGQKIRAHTPETALVWRQGLRPLVTACTPGEAVFIGQLLAGKSLLTSLDAASPIVSPNTSLNESEPFDFNVWLTQAVHNGLLLGVRLI